jgi:hypothetical protein
LSLPALEELKEFCDWIISGGNFKGAYPPLSTFPQPLGTLILPVFSVSLTKTLTLARNGYRSAHFGIGQGNESYSRKIRFFGAREPYSDYVVTMGQQTEVFLVTCSFKIGNYYDNSPPFEYFPGGTKRSGKIRSGPLGLKG